MSTLVSWSVLPISGDDNVLELDSVDGCTLWIYGKTEYTEKLNRLKCTV